MTLKNVFRVAVLHETARYFGWDDEESGHFGLNWPSRFDHGASATRSVTEVPDIRSSDWRNKVRRRQIHPGLYGGRAPRTA